MASQPPIRQRHRPPRHPAAPPHHRALQAATYTLTAVTVAALLCLASLFLLPQPAGPAGTDGAPIRRFYAAANEILAGGGPAAFEAATAPDLVEHRPEVAPGDRAALVQRLTAMGRSARGVRLMISAIAADGEWAAARVATLGLRREVHGVPLAASPAPPESTDFFRVADGKVVEYWSGGAATDAPRALPPIVTAPWVTDTAVALARLTFPPGAALAGLDAPKEHLILVESGELRVRLDGPASLIEAERAEAGWQATSASGQELVLRSDDALLLLPGTRHAIANPSSRSATALGVALLPTAVVAETGSRVPSDNPRLADVYDPRRVGTRTSWGSGVAVEVLAAGLGVARPGACAAAGQTRLALTRFSLAPGETISAHSVAGLELLAVDAGGLDVRGTDAVAAPPPSVRGSGQGLALPPPAAPAVQNAGPRPLSLVAVALVPTGGTSCAVAPIET